MYSSLYHNFPRAGYLFGFISLFVELTAIQFCCGGERGHLKSSHIVSLVVGGDGVVVGEVTPFRVGRRSLGLF